MHPLHSLGFSVILSDECDEISSAVHNICNRLSDRFLFYILYYQILLKISQNRNDPFYSHHVQFRNRLHNLHQFLYLRLLCEHKVIIHPQEVLSGYLGDSQIPTSKPALIEGNILTSGIFHNLWTLLKFQMMHTMQCRLLIDNMK